MTAIKWHSTYERTALVRTTEDVISSIIDDAPSYHDGKLETLRAKLDKLQQVVSTLAGLLPADVQRALVEAHGFNYEESTE